MRNKIEMVVTQNIIFCPEENGWYIQHISECENEISKLNL